MRARLAGVLLLVIVHGAAADEPRPEDTVGTWRGRAIWKGCSVAGNAQVVVDVTWQDGVFHADLAGARDDLGDVSLVPRADGTAAGTRDDLKVAMKPGASARMTLASDAGCAATFTLARDGTGIAACDRLLGLARVESTCDAAGDSRTAQLDDLRGRLAGWKKLRGKAKKLVGDQCTKDGDELAATLGGNGCLPATGPGLGSTGIPACDDYIETIRRYAQCSAVPVEEKQSLQQAMSQMVEGWKSFRDPSTSAEARLAAAEACKQASDAIRQSATAQGCAI